jgi:hypothetical protein
MLRDIRESVTGDVSSEFETGRMNVKRYPTVGETRNMTQKNEQCVYKVICADQRKKLQEASTELGISHVIIFNIVHDVI